MKTPKYNIQYVYIHICTIYHVLHVVYYMFYINVSVWLALDLPWFTSVVGLAAWFVPYVAPPYSQAVCPASHPCKLDSLGGGALASIQPSPHN